MLPSSKSLGLYSPISSAVRNIIIPFHIGVRTKQQYVQTIIETSPSGIKKSTSSVDEEVARSRGSMYIVSATGIYKEVYQRVSERGDEPSHASLSPLLETFPSTPFRMYGPDSESDKLVIRGLQKEWANPPFILQMVRKTKERVEYMVEQAKKFLFVDNTTKK